MKLLARIREPDIIKCPALFVKVTDPEDLDLDLDLKGFKDIHQMITYHIYEGYSEFDRYVLAEKMAYLAKNSLQQAVDYIQNQFNITVYKIIPEGRQKIRCITIDPKYKDAREREKDRNYRNIKKIIPIIDQLRRVDDHDDIVKIISRKAKGLIGVIPD